MAWPKSPLSAYVAGSLRWIKAFDLNAFQDAINRIINGTYSLAAFVVDGTGGNIVTPVAGTGQVSAYLSGTSYPTTAVPPGLFGRGGVPLGWAYVRGSDGALIRGYNIISVNRAAPASYVVVLNSQPLDRYKFAVICTAHTSSVGVAGVANANVATGGAEGSLLRVTVSTYTMVANSGPQAMNSSDLDFSILIFGE